MGCSQHFVLENMFQPLPQEFDFHVQSQKCTAVYAPTRGYKGQGKNHSQAAMPKNNLIAREAFL